jgi:predicted nucleic acid-binding protein
VALVADTNVLLYAVNRACAEHESCVNFLREFVTAGDTCFVPENVIYEFLRVATHPRVFPQPLRASGSDSFSDEGQMPWRDYHTAFAFSPALPAEVTPFKIE